MPTKPLRKLTAVFLCMVIALSFWGCTTPAVTQPTQAPQATEPPQSTNGSPPSDSATAPSGMTPGIYEASAQGFLGDITLHVKVDDAAILAIDATNFTERPLPFSTACFEMMAERIIENQSINVDTVAGATITSFAVRSAVQNALEQAGADIAVFETTPAEVTRTAGADETVDVLVIGAGGAGMMATLSSAYNNLVTPGRDLKIMLVEKLSYYGGSTAFAGEPFFKSNGTAEAAQATVDFAKARAGGNPDQNEALIANYGLISNDTALKMSALGANITYDFDNNSLIGYARPDDTASSPNGYNHTEFMARKFRANSDMIDLRLNTKAEELIIQDGAVIGAKMTGLESTYSVYAKKVILATGGFAQNKEMIEKYAPEQVGVIPYASAGSTGDGLVMAEVVDAALVGENMLAYVGGDFRQGLYADFNMFHVGGYTAVHVNKEGKRFFKDSQPDSNMEAFELLKQPEQIAYGIIDSAHPNVAMVKNTIFPELMWTADSLEELAGLIEVPADSLIATIDAYNAAYDAGEDAEFNTPNDQMIPVKTGPFYAFVMRPIAIGSLVSLKVSENCEVINNSGEIVPNLYAAGEMCFGGNLLPVYSGSWGLGTAINTGRIAGEHARASIKGN